MRIKINFESPNTKFIFTKFVVPFLKYKPRNQGTSFFIEHTLFHIHERSIQEYRVEQPFRMPGLYRQTPTLSIRDLGYREVTASDRIWVRKDITQPDRIDVEIQFANEDSMPSDQVFLLTKKEFKSIQPHLKAFRWRGVDIGGPEA